MFELPSRIGTVTLLKSLGRSGITEAFEGRRDEEPQRKVFVRRILPEYTHRAGEIGIRIRDLMALRHPFLVPVVDMLRADNEFLMIEDWVDGVTLSHMIAWCVSRQSPLPHNVFLNLATQICNGLEALHGRPGKASGQTNVLHLALNPDSIFVTQEGKIALGRYGLTQSPDMNDPSLKIQYLSPEQTHQDQRLMPASDIFSLASILYELLTSRSLFNTSQPMQLIHQLRKADVQLQLQTIKDQMPGLDKVLFRALSLSPRHRYQRAFVLREDLRGLMAGYSFASIESDTRAFVAKLLASPPAPTDEFDDAPATRIDPDPLSTAAFAAQALANRQTPKPPPPQKPVPPPIMPPDPSATFGYPNVSPYEPPSPTVVPEPINPTVIPEPKPVIKPPPPASPVAPPVVKSAPPVVKAAPPADNPQDRLMNKVPPPVSRIPEAPKPIVAPPIVTPPQALPPVTPPIINADIEEDTGDYPKEKGKGKLIFGMIAGGFLLAVLCAGGLMVALNYLKGQPSDIDNELTEFVEEDTTPALADLEPENTEEPTEPIEEETPKPVSYTPPTTKKASGSNSDYSSNSNYSGSNYSSSNYSSSNSSSRNSGTKTSTGSTDYSTADLSSSRYEPTSYDASTDLGTSDDSGATLDRYSKAAENGSLSSSDIMVIEMIQTDDPEYSRSRKLLVMNAKAKSDDSSLKRYIDQLLMLPENKYDPVILVELARYYINKKDYKRGVEQAALAERYWARIPPELIFVKKTEIYEIQAKGYQGLFYESEDNLELLDKAVRGWEKYKEHVQSKRGDLSATADKEIEKLESIKSKLQ